MTKSKQIILKARSYRLVCPECGKPVETGQTVASRTRMGTREYFHYPKCEDKLFVQLTA